MQPPRDNHQVSEAQHFEKLVEAIASFVLSFEHVGLFCPDARTGPVGPALRTRRDGRLACMAALLEVEPGIVQAARPSPIVWRAVCRAAIEDRGAPVKTKQHHRTWFDEHGQ